MGRPPADRAALLPVLGEVFRAHGYEGASLALIGAATGLGKGSLYHFFPGGKEEMAAAVLGHIDDWFESHVFAPLEEAADPVQGCRDMLAAVDEYFHSGRRVCLIGVLALGEARDLFAERVNGYFRRWVIVLALALERAGHGAQEAMALSEEAVAVLQGALVLARALDEPAAFSRALKQCESRLGL